MTNSVLIPSRSVKRGDTHLSTAAYRYGRTLTSRCAGEGRSAVVGGAEGGWRW
jgi:hypothetical protein